jgi:hypothetical protein
LKRFSSAASSELSKTSDNGQRIDPLASLLHTIASGNSSGFKPVARDPEQGMKE